MSRLNGFLCRHCHHETLIDTDIQGLDCPACGKADALYHEINVKGSALSAYAWPGGYPILYVDSRSNVYCAKCAAEERDSGNVEGALSSGIHWEGPPELCDVCGAEIESAYGDPESDEEGA